MFNLKSIVPLGIKKRISSVVNRESLSLPTSKRAFLFLSADYGNIGDIAITAAQSIFMANQLKGYTIVQVPISRTRAQINSINKQIRTNDLVSIIGGGNMGSLYPDIEELRQLVIRSFPNNRIVCFPQTLDWDDSAVSARGLARIVKTYSTHRDIHVFARESITRDKLASLFRANQNVNIGYTPDIVLSATSRALGGVPSSDPAGILCCLRDDQERALSEKSYNQLDKVLAATREGVEVTDTHAGGSRLSEAQCARLLSEKINQFGAARLVVTDRLHGMILSLLAGTPCLVVPNSNHKIRQTWRDWLGEHPLVAFMEPEHFERLPHVIDRLMSLQRGDIVSAPVNIEHFEKLKEALICA